MTIGYLAILIPSDASLATIARQIAERVRDILGFEKVFDSNKIIIIANISTPIIVIPNKVGVVVGSIFDRNSSENDILDIINKKVNDISSSKGEIFIKEFWGSYVGFIDSSSDENYISIIRDPSGFTPCFRAEIEEIPIYFSDIDFLLKSKLFSSKINWDFIVQHLAYPNLRTASTGILGVTEVVAGTRVEDYFLSRKVINCWSPWDFASRDKQMKNRSVMVDNLRDEVSRCVKVWADKNKSFLMEVSGGLDSSIVATCLSNCESKISCITIAARDPAGDERKYARLVADFIGRPLLEVELLVEESEIISTPARRLPRPAFSMVQHAFQQNVARQATVNFSDGIFSGGGGDNVFCSLNSASPAADALFSLGFGRVFLKVLRDLSALHQVTIWKICKLSLKKMIYNNKNYSWKINKKFLSNNLEIPKHEPHPWLDLPSGALPGKFEHIRSLMVVQTTMDGMEGGDICPVYYPLLSQPLVELCLSIPTWEWVSDGINRSVVRESFDKLIPDKISKRRGKGNYITFAGEVFEKNREVLRDILIGGVLHKRGIIDANEINNFLNDGIKSRDSSFLRMFEIANTENWVKSME